MRCARARQDSGYSIALDAFAAKSNLCKIHILIFYYALSTLQYNTKETCHVYRPLLLRPKWGGLRARTRKCFRTSLDSDKGVAPCARSVGLALLAKQCLSKATSLTRNSRKLLGSCRFPKSSRAGERERYGA